MPVGVEDGVGVGLSVVVGVGVGAGAENFKNGRLTATMLKILMIRNLLLFFVSYSGRCFETYPTFRCPGCRITCGSTA